MLKSLARVFEFKENSISKAALRRLLVLMVLSLPTFPLTILYKFGYFSNPVIETIVLIAVAIGLISTFAFMSTRFVNRFYFPDKYLDEWEIRVKHKSMAFTFMVMFWIVPLLILAVMLIGGFNREVSGIVVFFWGMGFLLGLCYVQIFHALWQVRPIDPE